MNKKNIIPTQTKPTIRASVGTRIQDDLITEQSMAISDSSAIAASHYEYYYPMWQWRFGGAL
ncbi:MAG: hypothetical protein F6K31_11930 [Symploca sp. SIO2G7]|nr:hypothetical protein [Symploca sp. SIO2G7]